tara:strand:+ start:357 stop:758 length:402 start_codon:yes stop_codon:yes gene_type:complete
MTTAQIEEALAACKLAADQTEHAMHILENARDEVRAAHTRTLVLRDVLLRAHKAAVAVHPPRRADLTEKDADNLRQLAANWVRKGRVSRAADIDAAACGTTRDYRTAAAAEEAFEAAGDAFETELAAHTSVRL